jgi:hypothetical protein
MTAPQVPVNIVPSLGLRQPGLDRKTIITTIITTTIITAIIITAITTTAPSPPLVSG